MLQNLPFCTFGFLVCVLVALPPSSAHGQCEMGPLIPADPDHYATIHQAGAIDGDTIVANDRNRMGFYIFERTGTTWVETAHTAGPDVALTPLAISGDLIVAGDAVDDEGGDDAGAAYVYRRSGDEWVQAAKLIAGDAAPEDHFGVAVAIDGDYVVVGQVRWGYGEPPGSAYVFRREGSTWVQEAELLPDEATDVLFGNSVALSGDVALVGAAVDPERGSNAGAAYVFRYVDGAWSR